MLHGKSSYRIFFSPPNSSSGEAHSARSFHDAASIPSIPSPYARGEAFVDSKRKQTILSLLDVLSELSNEAPNDNSQLSPSHHLAHLIASF